MPQLENIPKFYKQVAAESKRPGALHLQSNDLETKFDLTFEPVLPNVLRTTFSSTSHPLPPYPSIPPPEGDISGTKVTSFRPSEQSCVTEVGNVRVSIEWSHAPVVSLSWLDSDEVLHSDLSFRSYVVDGPGIAHYTQHDRKALHVGLGEKAAPMDLTARHFQMSATDCFGYEAYATDPMYKMMPLLVKATSHGCIAMVSTSHSRGSWSVGSEIDGLWGHFKVYRQDYGGLEEYLIVARTLKDVVYSYAQLAGFPLLSPRWAYGYISGGYRYTALDDPPAHQALLEFAEKLKKHDIPCSGHQMSSGYSIAETEPRVRNVFTWNKHRFPDPEEWIRQFHAQGIKLLTNVKPFVLASHPDYEYLVKKTGLFTDPRRKKNAEMRLWSAGGGESGIGGHLDFTSAATYEWWARGVERLKEQGIDGMWNDNNEYPLPNDDWQLALETLLAARPDAPNKLGLWGRAMHSELMAKASYEGLLRAEPGVRPFVLTRSASIGTLRYASSSWSGDNMTSWESMKAANAISLNAGISLLQCYGHDIGGFEGPQPSPELLLRWIQLGCHQIRFAINCFKTSPQDNQAGEVIEPWMYPEITPLVRMAIKRRYEIMPYIYSLGLESHLAASPPQRWIGWGYESDPEVWTKPLKSGEEQYWFGDTLLIGGVYQPGVDTARMYLPRRGEGGFDYGYVNLNAPYDHLASGQWVTVSSPWRESIPIFAKVGGALPVGKSVQTRMPGDTKPACQSLPEDDYRGVEIFPPKGSSHGTAFTTTWYEDDGMSLHPDISSFTVSYSSSAQKVAVSFTPALDNLFLPPWRELEFILPRGDERYIESTDGVRMQRVESPSCGRVRFKMPVFAQGGGTGHEINGQPQ
ncbi:alpha-glucosidase [Cladophialophora yegresii CBS 114405]|uniref:alpha-glucosidase n=1 Tax=Cladophialophora yegresii CBS 114405 TaxID=1182544 RepID=W9W2G8_9EURO|nr:alpha-glucosidase [Cladophialophora yegresii CBS 114405]EXJ62257.1 alpha-glucosidase [Cladophialophora yegresii CBS 114405]